MKMRAEIAKNKFSDIGLASSKGLFFERPNYKIHSYVSPWLLKTVLLLDINNYMQLCNYHTFRNY